ncbi:hypothetical protein JMUB6875_54560 [Nocardia sp. JMUB6875]
MVVGAVVVGAAVVVLAGGVVGAGRWLVTGREAGEGAARSDGGATHPLDTSAAATVAGSRYDTLSERLRGLYDCVTAISAMLGVPLPFVWGILRPPTTPD